MCARGELKGRSGERCSDGMVRANNSGGEKKHSATLLGLQLNTGLYEFSRGLSSESMHVEAFAGNAMRIRRAQYLAKRITEKSPVNDRASIDRG